MSRRYLHAILQAYIAGNYTSLSMDPKQLLKSWNLSASSDANERFKILKTFSESVIEKNLSGTSTATPNTTGVNSVKISIGVDSLGFSLTGLAALVLGALYGIYWVTRLVRCNLLSDNKVYVPEEQMTQRGFVYSRFGMLLKILTYIFGVWLQLAMLMAIIGHYQDRWPFDLSLAPGSVDWDSYTRVFLSAWTASIAFAVLVRLYRKKMDSFYLRPSSLSVARYVKLSQVMADDTSGHHDISVLHHEVIEVKENPIKHVSFLLRTFVWSGKDGMFVSGRFFDHAEPLGSELHAIKASGGLSNPIASERSRNFGRNEVILRVESLFRMTISELSTFFYMYQISAGCLLSLYWDYLTAGFFSLILIVSSAVIKVVLERREKLQLKGIATMHGSAWVRRDSHWTKVQSEELVVGDLICLSTDSLDTTKELTVDCVVVAGNAVVDESALTGETMPVQKFAAPSTNTYVRLTDEEASIEWRKFCLFAGTSLLQGSGALEGERPSSITDGALAVVTSTGSNTLRGKLIRSLVYGSGAKSAFWAEYTGAMAILVFLAGLNFLVINTAQEISMGSILPAITSVVSLISPLLSVALLGGEIRSSKRLASHGIHTRDMHKLTVAGRADTVLLDKTGTITKSGLEFRGVVPEGSARLCECVNKDSPVPLELSACVALAHSVSKCNNELVGNEVELRMVEAAARLGWKLDTEIRAPLDPGGNRWVVEKLFPFSHETMTMSAVVTQKSSGQRLVLCKGSFEALVPRCTPTSVNEDMKQAVGIYAQEGCYILGACMRFLEPGEDVSSREAVEKDLSFLGLILFRNELKQDSEICIGELKRAGIDVAMLTGDSVFTGCSVARSVGIVPPSARVVIGLLDRKTNLVEWRLADTDALISEETLSTRDSEALLCITGEVYENLKMSGKLDLERTKVFARVSPGQKSEIVRMYSSTLNRTVIMCGDGANDSLALRVAHAGLAVSSVKAEASVAAPFSSSSDSLGALVTLLKEARCAMTTSLAAYRFLIAVGLIQTISKTMLFLECGGFLSGVACLFIDCIQVPLMLYCICCALPASKMAKAVPEGSLMGPEMIFGVVWTVVSALITMAILENVMKNASWFHPFVSSAPLSAWQQRTNTFESSLVVLLRLWLYLDIAFVYSYGSVHRQNVMKNWRLLLAVVLIVSLIGYLLFGPIGVPQAAFVVQINKSDALAASSTFLNYFLFYYERVGGVWYGMTDSIEFPLDFRFGIVATFLGVSAIHHIGFRLAILGPLGRWFHDKVKWSDGSCSCCRRRRRKGYTPLKTQTIKFDALDESILQSAEQDSPAAEWELRRTYGRWRAPTDPEYK